MKKHNLYFEIKKNLVFSLLNFLYKSVLCTEQMDEGIVINYKINTLQDLIKLISKALNFSFFINFASIIQISVI